jgi:hypothetical protein
MAVGDNSSELVLDPLELGNVRFGTTIKQRIAVAKPGGYKGCCNGLSHVIR